MKLRQLVECFGENAIRAREIMRMPREELIEQFGPVGPNTPTYEIVLEALNALGDDKGPFHGVESFETREGVCYYLNAGDTYATTLVYFLDRFHVTTWGDIAEAYGNSDESDESDDDDCDDDRDICDDGDYMPERERPFDY